MDSTNYAIMEKESQEPKTVLCVVADLTPNSQQKKVTIVVHPTHTVEKVINDLKDLFSYSDLDLILQPLTLEENLVYLNERKSQLLYEIPEFNQNIRNTLVLLQTGQWTGDVKMRFNTGLCNINDGSHHFTAALGTNVSNNTTTTVTNNISSNVIGEPTYSNVDMSNVSEINVNPDALSFSLLSDGDSMTDGLVIGAYASAPVNEGPNYLGKEATSNSAASNSIFHYTRRSNREQNLIIDTNNTSNESNNNILSMHSPPALSSIYNNTNSNADGYVGLVNQAMTCYLNSLLQSLFMTPEFRNAVYRCEFFNTDNTKNIPFQLQKLFLKLQISKRSAVETIDLTRSFGWNHSEAWQQHDIEELCQVMFDALEQQFRYTSENKLISNLYEGKMMDYVKCLECNTQKSREEVFLDIALSVRPFDDREGFHSVEEALNAFVTPEILDGNNKYSCDKCDKKCKAHKGFKIMMVPYIVTLHLKRFSYDHLARQRIKINNRMTFPPKLDLTTLINTTKYGEYEKKQSMKEQNINNNNNNNNNVQENGGDYIYNICGSEMDFANLCNGFIPSLNDTTGSKSIGVKLSDEKSDKESAVPKHLYELFAIMIHSGGASGGHYYAYIKDFDTNLWYNFNDQTVQRITLADIEKSFGSPSLKYERPCTTGMSAYMLMYRKVDKNRNETFLRDYEFPGHIKKLSEEIKQEEEFIISRANGQQKRFTSDSLLSDHVKPRVHFYNPLLKKMKMTRLYLVNKMNMDAILDSAYQLLNVKLFSPLEYCRLVAYNPIKQEIIRSFEYFDDPLTEMRQISGDPIQFLLEYRTPIQEFDIYEPDGVTWHIYILDPTNMGIEGPFLVYSTAHENGEELRYSIARRLYIREDKMIISTKARHPTAFITFDAFCSHEAQEYLDWLVQTHFRNIMHLFLNVPYISETNIENYRKNLMNNNETTSINHFNTTQKTGSTKQVNHQSNSSSHNDNNFKQSNTSNIKCNMSSTDKNSSNYFFASKIEVVDPQSVFSRRSCQGVSEEYCNDSSYNPVYSYKIYVSSLMKMKDFKSHIGSLIQVPANNFILYRKNYKTPGNSATIGNLNEGETINIEIGCELKPNEYSAKIFYLRLDKLTDDVGRLDSVCEWVYTDDTTVLNAKQLLVEKFHQINKEKYQTLHEDNCRLWLKGGRNLVKIYDNDDVISLDVRTSVPLEIIVQECEENVCPQPSIDDLVIFIRRWYPEHLKLGVFQEVILNKKDELRDVISNISKIPIGNIAYCKASGNFPNTNISMLSINASMSWFVIPATMDMYPLSSTNNGNVYFYKDNTVAPMELTLQERCDFSAREKKRLDLMGCSNYSPRRDCSLKIFTDASGKAKTSTIPNSNIQSCATSSK